MSVRTFIGLLAVVSTASGAFARAPLNLVGGNPDVASGFIAVDYNATTKLFTAVGTTQNLSLPVTPSLGLRLFSLSATIDNVGNLSGPGSLIVRGDFGGTDQVLFQSNTITAFGFGATNKFEFLFTQESGSLAPVGSSVGTILVDTGLNFGGGIPSFSASFSGRIFTGGPGFANADTFVPGPSALAVMGLGGLFAGRRRR